jgi:hypothetical protein
MFQVIDRGKASWAFLPHTTVHTHLYSVEDLQRLEVAKTGPV